MAETTPFTLDPQLTGIARAYQNPAYNFIAGKVLPRVGVGIKKFDYEVFADGSHFTVPNNKMGRTSTAAEVNIGSSRVTTRCEDYGLEDAVPMDDITQAANAQQIQYNPLAKATMWLTSLQMISAEKRVADIVQLATNYGTGLSETLSGTDQWSDDSSDPVKAMLEALDKPLMRPNVVVMGQEVWTALALNPNTAKRLFGNDASGRVVSPEALASALMVQQVLVGQAFMNTANPGQTASISRLWGKDVAMLFIDPAASNQGGITFGFTATFADRQVDTRMDSARGRGGSQIVRVTESCKELVCANRAGYLFKSAIA